jgi:hypothetical protein
LHHFFEAEVMTKFCVTDKAQTTSLHLQKNVNLLGRGKEGDVFLKHKCERCKPYRLKPKRDEHLWFKKMMQGSRTL